MTSDANDKEDGNKSGEGFPIKGPFPHSGKTHEITRKAEEGDEGAEEAREGLEKLETVMEDLKKRAIDAERRAADKEQELAGVQTEKDELQKTLDEIAAAVKPGKKLGVRELISGLTGAVSANKTLSKENEALKDIEKNFAGYFSILESKGFVIKKGKGGNPDHKRTRALLEVILTNASDVNEVLGNAGFGKDSMYKMPKNGGKKIGAKLGEYVSHVNETLKVLGYKHMSDAVVERVKKYVSAMTDIAHIFGVHKGNHFSEKEGVVAKVKSYVGKFAALFGAKSEKEAVENVDEHVRSIKANSNAVDEISAAVEAENPEDAVKKVKGYVKIVNDLAGYLEVAKDNFAATVKQYADGIVKMLDTVGEGSVEEGLKKVALYFRPQGPPGFVPFKTHSDIKEKLRQAEDYLAETNALIEEYKRLEDRRLASAAEKGKTEAEAMYRKQIETLEREKDRLQRQVDQMSIVLSAGEHSEPIDEEVNAVYKRSQDVNKRLRAVVGMENEQKEGNSN